jgi:hypothetical protein
MEPMDREQLLQEILRLPWRTVLALPLVPRQDQPNPRETALTCALTVRGAWCGRLVVRCDRSLAEVLALRLHGKTTAHDNVQALHWLTTTLTGALRRVVPRDLGFGFPLVVDHEPAWSLAEPTVILYFTSGVSALSIALYAVKDRDLSSSSGSDETPGSDEAANEPPAEARSFFAGGTWLTGT